MGKISEPIFRQIIYAPSARFRFPICCYVLKPERFKGDLGRKARPNCVLFDPSPVKLENWWSRCLSKFYQFGIGPNLWYVLTGRCSAVCEIRGRENINSKA